MKVLLTVTAVSLLVNYVETMVIPGIPTIQTDLSSTDDNRLMDYLCLPNRRSRRLAAVRKTRRHIRQEKNFPHRPALLHCGRRLSRVFHKHIHAYSFKSRARRRLCHSPIGLSHHHRYFPKRASSHCTGHNQRNLRHRSRSRSNHRRLHRARPQLAMGFPHRLYSKHHPVLRCCSHAQKRRAWREKQSRHHWRNHADVRHSSCAALSD